jgi:hypothetical protein
MLGGRPAPGFTKENGDNMTGRIPTRSATLMTALLLAVAAMAVAAGAASAAVVYNNKPAGPLGNLPSLGFEATSTSEFGGQLQLAKTKRAVSSVTVDMSSWACQHGANTTCQTSGKAKFIQPVTLRLYEVGAANALGGLIYEKTQTFAVRYRPSENPACPVTGEGNKGWGAQCFSGFLTKITFHVPQVTVPTKVIVAVAYNTQTYGEHPTGTPGPYDSLNVALDSRFNETTSEWEEFAPPSVGSDPAPADAYLSSTWSGAYCNAAEGTGSFRLDSGCWQDFQPVFEVKAS